MTPSNFLSLITTHHQNSRMAVSKTKTNFYFNSPMNSDHFPRLYFILQKNYFFCAWGPPQVFEIFFYICSICELHRSVEQNVLITNITFFFNINRIIRDILGTFERQKNQFLG
jgi:hypothetical protein